VTESSCTFMTSHAGNGIASSREGALAQDSHQQITITKVGLLAGVELKLPYHGRFLLASSNKRCLVGGPGFEPGASRSRTVGKFLQKCRKQSHSVRIFRRGAGSLPDLSHSSAGLLHEVLQKAAARHGDGSHRAEGRCAEPGPHAGHTYSGLAHSPTPRGFEDRDSDVHERPLMPPAIDSCH